MRILLAADIGGTQARFVLAGDAETGVQPIFERDYASARFSGAADALHAFLGEAPQAERDRIAAVCVAVAGPAAGERARLTNLGWDVHAGELAQSCGLPRVALVNDFSAIAMALPRLPAPALAELQAGETDPHAPRIVVGAGTGLGVAVIAGASPDRPAAVFPSEAGHMDFAPADALQERLWRHLRQSFGRVSCERVVSGPGLLRILSFFESQSVEPRSAALADAMMRSDPAGAIAELAMERRDPMAVKTLDLFISAFGSFAGNVTLALLARGGVYLAGGIAPRLASRLADGSFIRAFTAKGRFTELLSRVPVRIVREPRAGLLGALEIARGL